MRHFSFVVPVDTSPTPILSFVPRDTISVAIHAVAEVEIGVGGVTVGNGYPIGAGGSFGFNHDDFGSSADLVTLYGVAAASTDIRIFGFRRD